MSSANYQRRNASGARQSANNSKVSAKNEPADSRNTLLNKEEEYKKLNAELEKKTANLVFEAEQVLKANEKLIHETDYLNKIGEIDFLNNETKNDHRASYSSASKMSKNMSAASLINKKELSHFKDTINNLEDDSDGEINEYNDLQSENESDNNEEAAYQNLGQYKKSAAGHAASAKSVSNLVSKIVEEDDGSSNVNGLIPSSANDMSSTAQIRFLKAKLKVMQEEVEKLNGDINKRDEESHKLAIRCKELDEDRAKQLRISNSHQTQMDKFKKQNEELQTKINAGEIQMNAIKKENDNLKKDTKKNNTDTQQLELRLKRAIEEVEKYKGQAQRSSANSKDLNDQEKRRIEQLLSDNKRLQKQKTELIQAFKKQLKLIDILKKQKMHLEAAKLLQFSEEEFINALEWNSNNVGNPVAPAKPSTQPGSYRNRADPSPRRQQPQPPKRPPSGQFRQKESNNNNKKEGNKPQVLGRSISLNNLDQQQQLDNKNQHLMLDNLDYLDDDDNSYNAEEGENYYKAQMQINNDSNDEFDQNY